MLARFQRRIRTVLLVFLGILTAVFPLSRVFAQAPLSKTAQYEGVQSLWLLAHAYRFGVIKTKALDKALAYEILYLRCLPTNYPFKSKMLTAFSQELEVDDLTKVRALADSIEKTLPFSCPLNQEVVSQGLVHQDHLYIPKKNFETFATFDDFLKVVANTSPKLATSYEMQLQSGNQRVDRWVFGQVHIEGDVDSLYPELKGLVLDTDGFFLQKLLPGQSSLHIELPLYKPVDIDFYDEKLSPGVINLNHITLQKSLASNNATLVGYIHGKSLTPENSLVVLNAVSNVSDEPNFIYVHRLGDGQFYRRDLAPGNYQLFLATDTKVIEKNITLHAGELKQLKPIQLTGKA